MQHAGSCDVVQVARSAGNQTRVFGAPNPFANVGLELGCRCRCRHVLYPRLGLRRRFDGVHDVLIAGATAKIALDAVPDFVLGRTRLIVQ